MTSSNITRTCQNPSPRINDVHAELDSVTYAAVQRWLSENGIKYENGKLLSTFLNIRKSFVAAGMESSPSSSSPTRKSSMRPRRNLSYKEPADFDADFDPPNPKRKSKQPEKQMLDDDSDSDENEPLSKRLKTGGQAVLQTSLTGCCTDLNSSDSEAEADEDEGVVGTSHDGFEWVLPLLEGMSDEALSKAKKWCEEHGATRAFDIKEANMGTKMATALQLKPIKSKILCKRIDEAQKD